MLARMLLTAAAEGAAFGASANIAARKMQPATSKALATIEVGETTLLPTVDVRGGKASYSLWVIGPAGAQTVQVGTYRVYADMSAAVKQWQTWLESGGSVAAWLNEETPTERITTP